MNKVLWTFPVPSTALNSDVILVDNDDGITLYYDYYDAKQDFKVFHGHIRIKGVVAYKHTSEYYTPNAIEGTYDSLCEISESDWLKFNIELGKKRGSSMSLKHYAIYLDSTGMYQFIARGYEIGEIKEGQMANK